MKHNYGIKTSVNHLTLSIKNKLIFFLQDLRFCPQLTRSPPSTHPLKNPYKKHNTL